MYVHGTHGRVCRTLDLKSQLVVCCHVGAGSQTRVLYKRQVILTSELPLRLAPVVDLKVYLQERV